MSAPTLTRAPGGRPRDPDVDTRTLAAAVRLIARTGVHGWSTDDLATEAGVGKASIYRRWRTKDDVVLATVRHLGTRPSSYPAGGSIADCLVQLVCDEIGGTHGLASTVLIAALAHDPQLRSAWQEGPARRLRAEATGILVTSPWLATRLDTILTGLTDVISALRIRHCTTGTLPSVVVVRQSVRSLVDTHNPRPGGRA